MTSQTRQYIIPGHPGLHELGQGLRSESTDERIEAMRQLQEIGTADANQLLSAYAQMEIAASAEAIRARKRGRGKLPYAVDALVRLSLTFIPASQIAYRVEWTGNVQAAHNILTLVFIGACILTALAWKSRYGAARRALTFESRIFEEVSLAKAAGALSTICRALSLKGELRSKAAFAATQLIAGASERDLRRLSREATRELSTAIMKWPPSADHGTFREAAFKALSAAGTLSDLTRIQVWRARGAAISDAELVYLRAWRERMEEEVLTETLLRPSLEEETKSLLRPARQSKSNPEQLLRPKDEDTNKDEAHVITCP